MENAVLKDTSRDTADKSRDLSLDFLKSAAMVLVVFFHNLQLNPDSIADNIFMVWGNAAVPVFFLVSGALFFSRPFEWRRHIRHILTFYLAMAAWKAVYLGIYRCVGVPFPVSKRAVLSYLFLLGNVDGIPTGHLWFMEAMVTVLLAAPVLRICMERDRKLAWYLMAVCFVFNQLLADVNLAGSVLARLIGREALEVSALGEVNPLSFRYSNYMFYYMLGGFLQEKKREKAVSIKLSLLMVLSGVAGLMVIKFLQSGTFRWQNIHLASGYYWISTVVAASGMFFFACHIPFDSVRLLRRFSEIVGRSTLGIFYLHMPLIYILTPRLFARAAAWNGWVVNLLESLLIVALSCGVVGVGRRLPVIRRLF